MVTNMHQLRCESNSAGWVGGETSLSSTVGSASSAGVHCYSLISAKWPHTFENNNTELVNLMQAKFPQGIKKSICISQSLISPAVLFLF